MCFLCGVLSALSPLVAQDKLALEVPSCGRKIWQPLETNRMPEVSSIALMPSVLNSLARKWVFRSFGV